MSTRSSKKKHNKRSNFHQHSSSMASSPFFTKRNTITSISLIISAIIIISITSISFNLNKSSFEDLPKDHICSIEVVNEFPHDPNAFTQGLLYAGNDTLFESTGLHGHSSVRKVFLHTGKVEVLHNMDYSYFAEGLTLLGERLFQVVWQKKTGFVYDRHNLSKMTTPRPSLYDMISETRALHFACYHPQSYEIVYTKLKPVNQIEKFTHDMRDGWGLATDGEVLFGSDGSSTLYRLNPLTFRVIDKAIVKYNNFEVHNLNELEYVNGEVWANVWSTDCIARISPKGGAVLGWILLPNLRKQLLRAGNNYIDVLNGIAWDSEKNRIFVTGKQWPKLYEVKLHPVKKDSFHGSIEQLCLRRRAFDFVDP